jgi:hypothetical protein
LSLDLERAELLLPQLGPSAEKVCAGNTTDQLANTSPAEKCIRHFKGKDPTLLILEVMDLHG